MSDLTDIFFTNHDSKDLLWICYGSNVEAWSIEFIESILKITRFMSESALSACPIHALDSKELDVLLLLPENTFLLWNRYYGMFSCVLSKNFQGMFDQKWKTSKRRRSLIVPEEHISSDMLLASNGSRIVQLKDSVNDRLNFVLANGIILRAQLNFQPKSTLVQRALLAFQGNLPADVEKSIIKRYLAFQYGSNTDAKSCNDEFTNFMSVILSFSDSSLLRLHEQTNTSESDWDKLQNLYQRHHIGKNIPGGVLKGFQKGFLSTTGRDYFQLASNIRCNHSSEPSFSEDEFKLILQLLHHVYESLKLNNAFKNISEKLAHALCALAELVQSCDFLFYYIFDGINYKVLSNDLYQANSNSPFNFYDWAIKRMKIKGFFALPADILNQKKSIDEMIKIASFYEILFAKGAEEMVQEMIKRDFTAHDLNQLPVGLSLPFREALFACKSSPPDYFPYDAYLLIGREDLAELLQEKPSLPAAFTTEPVIVSD